MSVLKMNYKIQFKINSGSVGYIKKSSKARLGSCILTMLSL